MSGLNWQVAPIAFVQGLDNRTQPKLVIPGKWRTLVNWTLSADNSLKRRDGISTLVAAATGNSLATYNQQLLVCSGPSASSISTAAAAASAVAVTGKIGNVDISKAEVRRNTGFQSQPDCAYGDGYTLYAWTERSTANAVTGVNCTLVDEVTGARLLDNSALRTNAAVFGVRTVFVGNAFFIFYIQGTSLYCRVIATSAPTVVGAEVALITSASLGNLNFDACAFGANSGVMVIYSWGDGVTSVRTIEVIRTGTVPSINAGPTNLFTEVNVPVATITALCCAAFSSGTNAGGFVTSTGAAAQSGLAGVVIGTAYTVTTAAAQLNPTVGATTAACHLGAVVDSTRLRVFVDFVSEWGTAALNQTYAQVVDSTLATFSGPTNIVPSATFAAGAGLARGPQGPFIHGKPFTANSRIYLPMYVASVYTGTSLATSNPRTNNQQNTFFVLDTGAAGATIAAGVVVAKALYGSYGVASINGTAPPIGTPCSSPQTTTGNYATVSGELTQLVITSTAGLNVSPTGLVRLTMTPNASLSYSRAQLGESTYMSGGSLSAFDGSAIVEHGFPLFPEGIGVTANGAGTGAVTDGVHQICVVAEWVDNAGQRHQSAPCLAVQATLATGANSGSFTVNIPTLLVSQKTGITFSVYMTQAGGLTFNRVLLNNAVFAPLANSTAASNVNFTIDDSDASIAGNELLYTQPNQAGTTLPNVAPGPTDAIAIAHNRLWFKRSDQPGGYGFSQAYVNNLGLQFSPDLGGILPLDAGPLIGIAALDEKVVLLCRRRLFVVYGTGPQPSGAFSNYSEPQEIPSDVGCVAARTILPMPMGIMFQSQKGIHLLGRDLSVSFIGEDIAGLTQTSDGPVTIYAATLLEDRKECRFVSRVPLVDGSQFMTFVFSYLVGQWSTFRGTPSQSYGVLDAIWWPGWPTTGATSPGSYVHVSDAEGVNYDNPAVYADSPGGLAAAGVTATATTGWLKVSALEGFQRIRWLYLTATNDSGNILGSGFSMNVTFDDGLGLTYSVSAMTAGSTLDSIIDVRSKLRNMKCKSVSFEFIDSPSSGAIQPLTGFQAMALEVGIKKGVNRLLAAKTVG